MENIIKEEEEEAIAYKKEVEETDYIVKEEEDLELEKDEVVTQANYQGGNRI